MTRTPYGRQFATRTPTVRHSRTDTHPGMARSSIYTRPYRRLLGSVKATRYFKEQVLRKRPYIDPAWCTQIVSAPLHREEQPDGRVRLWWQRSRPTPPVRTRDPLTVTPAETAPSEIAALAAAAEARPGLIWESAKPEASQHRSIYYCHTSSYWNLLAGMSLLLQRQLARLLQSTSYWFYIVVWD